MLLLVVDLSVSTLFFLELLDPLVVSFLKLFQVRCHAVKVGHYAKKTRKADCDCDHGQPKQVVVLYRFQLRFADAAIHFELHRDRAPVGEVVGLLEEPVVAVRARCDVLRVVHGEAKAQREGPHLAQPNFHSDVVLRKGTQIARFEKADGAWLSSVDVLGDQLDWNNRVVWISGQYHVLEVRVGRHLVKVVGHGRNEVAQCIDAVDRYLFACLRCAPVPRRRHEPVQVQLLRIVGDVGLNLDYANDLEGGDAEQQEVEEESPRKVVVLLVAVDGAQEDFVFERDLVLLDRLLFESAHLIHQSANLIVALRARQHADSLVASLFNLILN